MGDREAKLNKRKLEDVSLEEHEAETEVSPEDVKRVLELLARWALRGGQKE